MSIIMFDSTKFSLPDPQNKGIDTFVVTFDCHLTDIDKTLLSL